MNLPIPDPTPSSPRTPAASWRGGMGYAGTLLATLAVIAALAFAKAFVIPLALACLFGFLLTPLADRLEALRIGRGPSAVFSVLLLGGVLAGVGWLVAAQAVDLARSLPEYRPTMERKLASIQSESLGTPLFDALERLQRLDGELATGPGLRPPGVPAGEPPAEPVAVEVVPKRRSVVATLSAWLGPLVAPLGGLVLMMVLTGFLLSYRKDLRGRLIRLVSRGHIGLTAQAFEDASRRVSRYLAANLFVNTLYGLVVGLGLWAIGLPTAPLWGVLAGLLRFVPYLGTWIGAAFPLVVSILVFEGWGQTLAVFLLILVADTLIGNVLEAVVYGRRTGLSPLVVVLSTFFWTWLWGIPGLLLALPMTLCLSVAGRYVPGLEILGVLLGDAPALGPEDRFYERLLALDPDTARTIAEERLQAVGPEATYDDVVLAALARAEADRHAGVIDDDRLRDVCTGALEAAEVLAVAPPPAGPDGAAPSVVLCVPAGRDADHASCELLARRLAADGIVTEVAAPTATSGEIAERVEQQSPALVVVAAVPPFGASRARYVLRRIRSRAAATKVVAAVWRARGDRERIARGLAEAGATRTGFSLAEVVEAVRALLAGEEPPPAREDARPRKAAEVRS
jgi:predicted PurR-regulated permease PerM